MNAATLGQPLDADVLAIASALCQNPEAFKSASEQCKGEFIIKVDPSTRLTEMALDIVRHLRDGQVREL